MKAACDELCGEQSIRRRRLCSSFFDAGRYTISWTRTALNNN